VLIFITAVLAATRICKAANCSKYKKVPEKLYMLHCAWNSTELLM